MPAATPEPDSIFGSFILDDTYRGLHLLTVPLTLAPIRLDAGRSTVSSRFSAPVFEDGGIHFPRASRRFVSESPYLVEYCQWDDRSGRVMLAGQSHMRLHVATIRRSHPLE